MRKILHRYIFKEIAGPFALILFVLTFVLLMAKIIQLMDLMVNKGVSAFDIAKLLPVTYVVAVLLMGMGALLIYADIVKPVNLFG